MKLTDEEQFARNLQQRRLDERLSQSELARRMVEAGWSTYSQMTVSRTEKGERPIRLGEARALATILRASLDDMIGATPSEALALQVDSVREELSAAIIEVRDAVGRWQEAASVASQLREDVEHELAQLDDPPEADQIRSSLYWIDLLNFDVQTVAAWAASQPLDHPEDRQHLTMSDIGELRALRDSEG